MPAGATRGRIPGLFQAALFDMDGTLVDSSRNGERAWRTLAARWQLAPLEDAHFLAMHGQPARQSFRQLLPAALVAAACREVEEIERRDTEGVVALPGAVRLFEEVPQERKAVVTSNFRAVAQARLDASGMVVPQNLVTAETIRHGKPHPEPFLTGAALLGVPAERTVAFEDTIAGVRSARAAGCTVIAVLGLYDPAELAEADHVVTGLDRVRIENLPDGLAVFLD